MKTEEICKVWNEMTKEELVYLVKAQKVEIKVQAKTIQTVEEELINVKAKAISDMTLYTEIITKLDDIMKLRIRREAQA